MDKLLEILAKIVPAGAAVAIIAFLYLVILFKRASDRFIELSQKQADFLKDRVDVVDKTSIIFTRAIEQQEKQILNLKSDLETVSANLAQTRSTLTDRSVEEVTAIGEAVRQVLKLQEATLGVITPRSGNELEDNGQAVLVRRNSELSRSFENEMPKLLGRRDLSRYPVEVSELEGADELIRECESFGLAASIYKSPLNAEPGLRQPTDYEAIWIGKRVSPEVALLVIKIGRKHWPFLKFIHLSGDDTGGAPDYTHLEVFLGGATSAAQRYGLQQWLDSEFDLIPTSTPRAFRAAIRSHYSNRRDTPGTISVD
jgi:hypothetical protein